MTVYDSSALLAYLLGEPGAEVVKARLRTEGGACGTANWSEVAQKVSSRGVAWPSARTLLLSYGLVLEPVTVEDAETAAVGWQRHTSLSLGGRLCLALGERLDAEVLTADHSWGRDGRIRQIR